MQLATKYYKDSEASTKVKTFSKNNKMKSGLGRLGYKSGKKNE